MRVSRHPGVRACAVLARAGGEKVPSRGEQGLSPGMQQGSDSGGEVAILAWHLDLPLDLLNYDP